LQTAD